jgi:hypothetical protein
MASSGALLRRSSATSRQTGRRLPRYRNAPVNALGYLRAMLLLTTYDTLARLRQHGAQLVDEDVYRLCYIRGPEGILIGLAEQIG